jgi:hypothetical protein
MNSDCSPQRRREHGGKTWSGYEIMQKHIPVFSQRSLRLCGEFLIMDLATP